LDAAASRLRSATRRGLGQRDRAADREDRSRLRTASLRLSSVRVGHLGRADANGEHPAYIATIREFPDSSKVTRAGRRKPMTTDRCSPDEQADSARVSGELVRRLCALREPPRRRTGRSRCSGDTHFVYLWAGGVTSRPRVFLLFFTTVARGADAVSMTQHTRYQEHGNSRFRAGRVDGDRATGGVRHRATTCSRGTESAS